MTQNGWGWDIGHVGECRKFATFREGSGKPLLCPRACSGPTADPGHPRMASSPLK